MNFTRASLLVFGVTILCNSVSNAAGQFLTDDQINESIEFLREPPLASSDEYKRDYEILEQTQLNRLEAQCKAAALEAPLNIPLPFVQPMGPLTSVEYKAWQEFADVIYHEIKPILMGTKDKWVRPRPYLRDLALNPCVPKEPTNSYPSGHATMGELFGRLFSEVYPERAEAFLARGKQYGQHRVLGGVHHPSDVKAGQDLADHMFSLLMQNPNFRNSLTELRSLTEGTH